MCASTGSVLGSCPIPPTVRFILFFETVPNNSPRSSVTGDESISRVRISSKATLTETLLEMLFADWTISLTLRAVKFAPLGSLTFVRFMASFGLWKKATKFVALHWDERTEPSARSPLVLMHYCTLTSRALDLVFVVVGR